MSKNELTDKEKKLISKVFKEFKPKPKSNCLEFARTKGVLSAESSAVTGRFVPVAYQEDILFDGSNSQLELIVWMKSTRVGYTTCVKFIIAYHIAEDPCPQLVFQPNDGKANEFSKKEIKPLLRDMPSVGERIYKNREDNNLNYKAYPGGFVSSLGGKTANNYASATAKKVFGDEYDRFPDDVDKEGDPCELMEKRTESYWDGTVLLGSTPTTEEGSKIKKQFLTTDMMYRYVPCPYCGQHQIIEFHNLLWEKELQEGVYVELTETAKLKCVNDSCGELIDHKFKRQMDNNGQWRQTQKFYCCEEWQDPKETRVWKELALDGEQDKKGYACCHKCGETASYNKKERRRRGYHINAMYSFQPNTTWPKVAEKFIAAKGNEDLMKVFKNTWLGETFEAKKVKISESKLLKARENYKKLPPEVEVLIMSVDTQGNRLEWTIKGWSKGETSYGINKGIIEGDPVNNFVWDELYEIAEKTYEREDGKLFKPFWIFIDSGGNRTEYVYNFVSREVCQGRFWAIKGETWENKDNDTRAYSQLSKNKDLPVPLILIATNKCKDLVYERLHKKKKGDYGYMWYNHNYDEEYFLQLTAEKKVFKKNSKGYLEPTYVNERTNHRNEAIDIEVYNLGAVKLLQQEGYIDFSI